MITDCSLIHEKLISRYSRSVIHMRKQLDSKRFSLIFGAGLNIPLNFLIGENWLRVFQRIQTLMDKEF